MSATSVASSLFSAASATPPSSRLGWNGYVWIGWDTLLNSSRCGAPIVLDWVPQTSEEVASVFAATSRG